MTTLNNVNEMVEKVADFVNDNCTDEAAMYLAGELMRNTERDDDYEMFSEYEDKFKAYSEMDNKSLDDRCKRDDLVFDFLLDIAMVFGNKVAKQFKAAF